MAAGIVDAMRDAQIDSVRGITRRKDTYKVKTITEDRFTLMMGDCVERIKEIPDGSVGMSIFSRRSRRCTHTAPATATWATRKTTKSFQALPGYLIPELLRVTMPGRRACVHVQQIAQTLVRDGVIGLYDFAPMSCGRSLRRGGCSDGECVIWKNPQSQSIRTRAKGLAFQQLEKDSSHGCVRQWLITSLLFRAPGRKSAPD